MSARGEEKRNKRETIVNTVTYGKMIIHLFMTIGEFYEIVTILIQVNMERID